MIEWARWILIGLWPSLMFQVLKKLLQGCGIVWPVILASLIAALANALSCYILIYKYNFSYDGVALSVGIAQWIGFLTLTFIIFLQMFYSRLVNRILYYYSYITIIISVIYS